MSATPTEESESFRQRIQRNSREHYAISHFLQHEEEVLNALRQFVNTHNITELEDLLKAFDQAYESLLENNYIIRSNSSKILKAEGAINKAAENIEADNADIARELKKLARDVGSRISFHAQEFEIGRGLD